MSGSAIKSNSKHQQHLELKPLSLSDNLCLDIIILSKVELLDSFLFFANTYTSYRSSATANMSSKAGEPPSPRYLSLLCEFMAFVHKKSKPYPKDREFTEDEFTAIARKYRMFIVCYIMFQCIDLVHFIIKNLLQQP